MRFPSVVYQMHQEIAEHFPNLRPSQQRWLALWVFGMIQAKSATQSAVVAALLPWGNEETLRQYLREGLYDGKDRAAPCSTQIHVRDCFPALLAWTLSLWKGEYLPLALDATLLNDELVSLTISLLYRGNSLPVAWTLLPANTQGEWRSHLLEMLSCLAPVVPPQLKVIVMADRGLWCPSFWRALQQQGWHPLMRLHPQITFAPCGGSCRGACVGSCGGERRKVETWLRGPGHAFLARGMAFRRKDRQLPATLLVLWETGEKEPWVLLTDLPPDPSLLRGYGLRFWIESGFRSLKGMGWQWQRTRRRDPQRVERHWLAMAVAQLWTLSMGTRAEDVEAAEVEASVNGSPGAPQGKKAPLVKARIARTVSLFRRGLAHLQRQWMEGEMGKPLWLVPEPWPEPPWILPNRITCIT